MLNGFIVKKKLASVLNFVGLLDKKLIELNQRLNNKYIRVINYHHITEEKAFGKQLNFFKERFDDINFSEFELFLKKGVLPGNKPGIILTFDDGYEDNYTIARKCLQRYGFTGWFMVSSDLLDTDGYMTYDQVSELLNQGHTIGCHTATHHRMLESDTDELLEYEVTDSKKKLEKNLGVSIDIFCWCGGEEKHYTTKAANKIKNTGYKYGFMTNSCPVVKGNDAYHIQRINIEDTWPVSLVKFQISGFMDKRMQNKRNRVNRITR